MKDNMILKTTEEIKAISDPYRLKIIRVLSSFEDGATASMVAEAMGEVPSKVYYHIKKLEKVGIVEIVKTEVVNGIVAKYYKKTAKGFTIDGDKDEQYNPLFLNETYKTIKNVYNQSLELMKEFLAGKEIVTGTSPIVMSASDVYLTEEEMKDLIEYISNITNNRGIKEKKEGAKKVHILFSIIDDKQ